MKAIDLGLSVKWSNCNIGANKPEDYGNYFAWGETIEKNIYNWRTYKWYKINYNTLTKYYTKSSYDTVDNKTVLELEDDAAARANLSGAWRMPTYNEWKELIDNCTWTWTDNYNGTGVAGQIVTSNINGNSIFLPAAGCRYYGDLYDAGRSGYYWSSSLNSGSPINAWGVFFSSDDVGRSYNYRYYGRSVRAVLVE